MDGKDNKKEKTREVPDIRMYHISWNFLQLGRDMLWWWWLTWKLFLLSTWLTTLSTCELVVDGNVDGNDNKEEKTREVANNRMYHFGCNKDVICCDEWVMLVDIKVFYSFNMSDNIKFMCVDGRRHWGWQGQLHVGDHGGWWHHDVSLQLECSSLRAGCDELCLCWVHLSVEHFQDVITSRFMTWHIRWRRSRRRRRTPARTNDSN